MKRLPKPTVPFSDCVRYLPVMLASNLAGTAGLLGAQILLTVLLNGDRSYTRGAKAYVLIALFVLASFAASLGVTYVLFMRNFDALFSADTPVPTVYANALTLILPAELLRFVLSALPWKPGPMFGYRFFDGVFTFIPSFLQDQLYLFRHGGVFRIREEGYLPGDHRSYFLFYLAYFLILCAATVLLCRFIHSKAIEARRAKEEKYAEDAKKSAKEYVRLRDFFYSSSVTRRDRLRYAAITFGAQFAAYLIAAPALTTLLTIYTGDSATNRFLQAAVGIPLAAILPVIFTDRLMRRPIREWFSLADEEKTVPGKLLSLMAPAEIARFLLGLLPFMGYGAYTAPLPAMLFSMLHGILTGTFGTDAAPGSPTFLHWILFFLLYLLCFAVHERILQKRLCRRVTAHLRYLSGMQAEKDKYQNYYHG